MWQNHNCRKLWIANTVSSLGTGVTLLALPLGALSGGWLAEKWGLRPTLLYACSGLFLGALWVWFSPLRTLLEFREDLTKEGDP
jgi:MFS family permease